jgi:hypothetical protein
MSPNVIAQSALRTLVPPDTVAETNGSSAPFELGAQAGKTVVLVLRISEIVEQESLHISIWGSADGQNWGDKALFWFPQRFYRGTTPAAVDLGQRPDVKFLQARWEVSRWGRCNPRAYFKFSVEVQELTAA